MKIKIFNILMFFSFFATGQIMDTVKVNGFIQYSEKYAKSQSIYTLTNKITTIFGKSNSYVSYLNSYIRDVKEYASESLNLLDDKSNESYDRSLNAAIELNKIYSKQVSVAYLINTKTKIRNSINYFYFIKNNNCFIIDTLKKLEYTYVESTNKNILGYSCKKLILTTTKATYDVWYTEDLPFNVGPLAFFDAPGAILEVDAPSLKIGYIATEVETKNLKSLLIKTIPFKHDNLLVNKEGYLNLLQKNNNARSTIR